MLEPAVRIPISHNNSEDVVLFTADQMEAYAPAKVREALEEAAEMADNVFSFIVGNTIRALIKG